MISDTLKIDKSWKFVQGLGLSSPTKTFYEEDSQDGGFSLYGDDIYVDAIPSTPPGVSTPIVEVLTDFVLINDISVSGNLSWYASTDGSTLEQMRATRQKDWIPPKFGQGYTVVLKDNTGQQIFTTDPIDWVFDYKTGILVCENDPDVSYTLPLKITAYRYIGDKLTNGSSASWLNIADAGGYFSTDNVESALQELGFDVDSNTTDLSDHISDTADAHDASAISILDAAANYTSDNVEGALVEIADSLAGISAAAADITVADAGGYFTGDNVEDVLQEIAPEIDANTSGLGTLTTNFNNHIIDAVDAHDASAISLADTEEKFVADNVEDGMLELWNIVDLNTSAILVHLNTSDIAHNAGVINVEDPLENFTETDLESVLVELSDRIDSNLGDILVNISDIQDNATAISSHIIDTIDAHAASAISVLDTGGFFVGDNVESVLAEIGVIVGPGFSALEDRVDINVANIANNSIDLENHENSGIHLASNVSVSDSSELFDGTNVEDVLTEIGNEVDINIADIADNAIDINNHIIDTVGAHAASAISVLDTGALLTADNVEDALAEIMTGVNTNATNLNNHIVDTIDAHAASAISVLDTGALLAADNAEDAFAEIMTALNGHISNATDAHDASAISVLDAGALLTADNAEDAFAEIMTGVNTNSTNLSNHITDTEDAHDASAVSLVDTEDYYVADNTEGALEETRIVGNDNEARIIINEVLISDNTADIVALQTENSNTNEYTPSGTGDSAGEEGDITYDDDFVYIKTSVGWQRAALSTF